MRLYLPLVTRLDLAIQLLNTLLKKAVKLSIKTTGKPQMTTDKKTEDKIKTEDNHLCKSVAIEVK